MNLAGIAHIQLTVSDLARSRAFYRALCEQFEMHCQYDTLGTETERATLYYIGGKTGLWSILFEDPDGMRLEINYVPGKGNLTEGIELPVRE